MLTHPYLTEHPAAQHRRQLLDIADRNRLCRGEPARRRQRTVALGITNLATNVAVRLRPPTVRRRTVPRHATPRRTPAISES
jgi:hypothetical protein